MFVGYPGEDYPDPPVPVRQGGQHPQGFPQQEPGGQAGLQQGGRVHGDHDPPLLQDHRVGASRTEADSPALQAKVK